MSDSRNAALIEMARTYVWRLEIESYQAHGLLQVLEGLGLIEEMHAVEISNALQEIFGEDEDILDECKWELNKAEALWTCVKSHDCKNKLKSVEESKDGEGTQAELKFRMDS